MRFQLLLAAFIGILTLPAQAKTLVPFKAQINATLAFGEPLHLILAGVGNNQASHLGRIGYAATGIINPDLSAGIFIETLTAANGDSLTFLCDQQLQILSPTQVHGIDSAQVIGGTGRFANATGYSTGTTEVDLATNSFTKIMTGYIEY